MGVRQHIQLFENLYLFGFKEFVFFMFSGEMEGPRGSCATLDDGGDEVSAAKPVGFGEVACRGLRRMVGVGVIKAYDLQAGLKRLAIGLDKVDGSDFVAVVRSGAAIWDWQGMDDGPGSVVDGAKKDAAALVRIDGLAVPADLIVDGLGDKEHSCCLFAQGGLGVRELKQSALLPIPISTLRGG
jgi:hypothetical protein